MDGRNAEERDEMEEWLTETPETLALKHRLRRFEHARAAGAV